MKTEVVPNRIVGYFHCKKCFPNIPKGESPRSYARLSCGVTDEGLFQIWCERCNENVTRLVETGG